MAERFFWESWEDEKLLELRPCDLGLTRLGPFLETAVTRLYRELDARRLRLRPHVWLSDDWFTPEGVAGMAVPFYLAHPRLLQLELDCIGEAEGGTPEACLRILRHEAGHALDHAFGLRRRRQRQLLFGRSGEPYPEWYAPVPYSRRHVIHLGEGYGQSHPDEDFAETFAVWLTPRSGWRRRYAAWPSALQKLRYVDEVMTELREVLPRPLPRREVQRVETLRTPLRELYRERQRRFLPRVVPSSRHQLPRIAL